MEMAHIKTAAAVTENGGVLVGDFFGQPVVMRCAGTFKKWSPENKAEYEALFNRAAKKLGLVRDKRCKTGYRREVK